MSHSGGVFFLQEFRIRVAAAFTDFLSDGGEELLCPLEYGIAAGISRTGFAQQGFQSFGSRIEVALIFQQEGFSKSRLGEVRVGLNRCLEMPHGAGPGIDEMLVLNQVFLQRRTSTEEAALAMQKPLNEARRVLERLTERGWLEARGEKRGRVYLFSPAIYGRLGQPEAYVRSKGIPAARHEAMIEEFARAHSKVVRANVEQLCSLPPTQASRTLKEMVKKGKLERMGTPPRWVYYRIPVSSQ
jgi:hypothetical protein